MSGRDYRKLFPLQDKVLEALQPILDEFYLTGGTALGRFYLGHRFSEDLDFFVNSDSGFQNKVKLIEKKLINDFSLLREQTVLYEDFVRYFINFEESVLKIEFVNDVQYRSGKPTNYKYGMIDTPLNILTNKLTAIVSRDEPKDIFDICSIARSYSFNWINIFEEAKKKVIINEIEVEQRIRIFPVTLFNYVDWLINPIDKVNFSRIISNITDDFILGKNNSLGVNKTPIEKARPVVL